MNTTDLPKQRSDRVLTAIIEHTLDAVIYSPSWVTSFDVIDSLALPVGDVIAAISTLTYENI